MFALRRKSRHHLGQAVPGQASRITIALGMPVTGEERGAIQAAIGPSYQVVDICEAPVDTSLVLVGPCSAAAIQMLTSTFPQAGVLVVERSGAATSGPVISALRAGALAYIVAEPQQGNLDTSTAA
jgi:hypothetical protein